ncbi:cell wall-active antibiotics response protein LiaF [Lihuaxuella thermophila]|uniref:Lia operon protein LiaF n=1 Tax=Lihuaxuella thermophila TaxID=1173111 RepID=A0A1H8GQD2_9BACL|nr:cell wall-active antibiotics response protein LiaF [Lihuaxuella thermophila]SEN46015.1 lia operon protein LiaF [Lihuaxuella thermophila]
MHLSFKQQLAVIAIVISINLCLYLIIEDALFLVFTLFLPIALLFFMGRQVRMGGFILLCALFFYFPVLFRLCLALLLLWLGYRCLRGEKGDSGTHLQISRICPALYASHSLLHQPFEMKDAIWAWVAGEIQIDLSQAILWEGENTIVVSGLMGDVNIYVPSDLEVSVSTSVVFGQVKLFGEKVEKTVRTHVQTEAYPRSSRKVKICLSFLFGDVDVRYL